MPHNHPPLKTAGLGAEVVLPGDPDFSAAALDISDELCERIGTHSDHSDDCPWSDPEIVLYGFGLVLSRLIADMIKGLDYEESDVDEFLASVRANAYALLKAGSDS